MTSLNKTLFVGTNHLYLDVVHSTNDYLSDLVSKTNPPEGTAISAAFQTNGKGQTGNVWNSQKGKNVLLSVLFRPVFLAVDRQFYLSKIAALSVKESIEQFLPSYNVEIKWPNDLLIGKKKVSGILIENSIQGSNITTSIAGVGVNINDRNTSDLHPNSISLIEMINSEIDLNSFMQALFYNLEKWYLKLKSSQFAIINDAYHNGLWKINDEIIFYDVEDRLRKGKLNGVSESGQLIVNIGDQMLCFSLREIKIKWWEDQS